MTLFTRRNQARIVEGGAALVLVVALAYSLNSDLIGGWRLISGNLLLYSTLTAFATLLSARLGVREFESVHAVGMMAFLTLSSERLLPPMLWAIFVGALVGTGLRVAQARYQNGRISRADVELMAFIVVRITLSFAVAAWVYLWVGGSLPLRSETTNTIAHVTLYGVVYITLYGVFYLIENYARASRIRELLRDSFLAMSVLLVLPTTYAVITALLKNEMPIELFGFMILGFILIVVTTFSYTRSQYSMQQRLHEMRQLAELSQSLQATQQEAPLLALIAEKVPVLLNVEHMLLARQPSDAAQALEYLVSIQNSARQDSPPSPADVYLVRQILEQRQPLLIERHVTDFLRERHISPHPFPVNSWLGVPILSSGGKVSGVLAVSTMRMNALKPTDLRLLTVLAANLGAALSSVQVYKQQQERLAHLSTLNTVSALLTSTLSPDTVLDTIASSAAMLAEARAVAVYLSPQMQGEDLRMVRSAGLSDSFVTYAPQPLLERFASSSQETEPNTTVEVLLVDDANTDRRTVHLRDRLADEGLTAFAEISLQTPEERLGVVVVYYQTPQTFSLEFVEFLRTFANEAVQAIRNAQLFTNTDKALERRLIELSILAALGQQTNSAPDLPSLSEILLQHALNYSQIEQGAVMLYTDSAASRLRVMASVGALFEGSTWQEPFVQTYVPNLASSSGTPQFVPLSGTLESATTDPIERVLVMPIFKNTACLGFMLLKGDPSQEESLRFLQQLVNHAAIAIDNVQLFETVRQSRDRMKSVLDTITEAIVLINHTGEVVQANGALSLLGIDEHALIANRENLVQESLDADTRQRLGFVPSEQQQLLSNLERRQWKTPMPPKHYTLQGIHGELYIQRQIFPISRPDGTLNGVLLVYYDQTEKRELDRTREEFTRMIVHDLRSPLTAITTGLRLIEFLVPPDIPNYDIVVKTSASNQQTLKKAMGRINAILDIAKMESGKLELDHNAVDFKTIVDTTFTDLMPLATERNVTLEDALPADMPLLYGDADKIERMLQNLVDNALKFTPSGTAIRVELREIEAGFATLQVIDMGPGIPNEYKERLFERFVQIRGQRGTRRGTGLGLTFCQLVVQAHGGKIWVEDNPIGGSIFAFTLPIEPPTL